MQTLWLAIFIYSVGLAAVLHLRPALMFNENGTWKEFGYQRDSRHTLFPVWLFAVAWAIVSYAVAAAATAIVGSGADWSTATGAVSAAASTAATWAGTAGEGEDEEEDEEEIAMPISKSQRRGRRKPKPGYYVLDPEQAESGLRRYIYYGQEPPSD